MSFATRPFREGSAGFCVPRPKADLHELHQSITDPARRIAAGELRDDRRWASATRIATLVEAHDLADYDRIFGLDDLEVA